VCTLECGQEHETHIQRTTREQEERIAAMQQEFMTQIARASEGHSRELDELQAEHAQEVGTRVCVCVRTILLSHPLHAVALAVCLTRSNLLVCTRVWDWPFPARCERGLWKSFV
jgi:hypothetical protein